MKDSLYFSHTNRKTEMTANQIISARIATLVAAGTDVRTAIDKVLGVGTFEKLAGDVYDALHARNA